MKKAGVVITYRWPITLWSVDDRQSARIELLRYAVGVPT
jgi:hypothetical protein